jgi:hypothetical protein
MKFVEEEIARTMNTPGPFSIRHDFSDSPPVFGIWIQPDGDDTQSSYEVTLRSLRLGTED